MAHTNTSKTPRVTRSLVLGLSCALAFGFGTVAVPASASEQTKPSVTIKKIKTKKAAYGKKATIKPSVKTKGKVKVTSKKLTVKQGKKTLAKNKTSVKLKPGTYKVTTTVKYKTGKKTTTTSNAWRAGSTSWIDNDTFVNCTISSIDFWLDGDPDYYDWQSVCTAQNGTAYMVSGDEWFENEEWVQSSTPNSLKVGATWNGTLSGAQSLTTAEKYQRSKTTWAYGKNKTKRLTQTLKITQGKKPTSTSPSGWNCPSGYPIKGNQSGIYHAPGGSFYNRTNPEECFATESAARNAGYRKSQR